MIKRNTRLTCKDVASLGHNIPTRVERHREKVVEQDLGSRIQPRQETNRPLGALAPQVQVVEAPLLHLLSRLGLVRGENLVESEG